MPDVALFTAAMQGLGVMKTLASGMVAVRDEAKMLETKLELLRQIVEVTGSIQDLQLQHQHLIDETLL